MTKVKPVILGISASLRNARRGFGNAELVKEINACKTEGEMKAFLEQEALTHLNNFKEAGRDKSEPFDQIYKNLKKLKGNRGLSNSEVALSSALWSAKEIGADIEHLSLSEYFKEGRGLVNEEEMEKKLIAADGIIISTPVYFGDRGSLSQSLITHIRNKPELQAKLRHKIYAGIAVGAKRNGGQETTLIYQLLDMINLGFLGVGNDSETTSQYGGTGLAGDIGTMSQDDYGLQTAMGTGRRIARVARMMSEQNGKLIKGKLKLVFWLLQDKNDLAKNTILELVKEFSHEVEVKILDFVGKNIVRCLACDICPTHIDVDEEYRCIIKSTKDDLKDLHTDLIDADAIIPLVYSAVDREDLVSNYQQLMERTRYIRRGDYIFSDLLTAPFVIEDIGSYENMQVRMMTSMIRHHTIMDRPIISYRYNGEFVNREEVRNELKDFIETARLVISAKILTYSSGVGHLKYKPVGYILSARKDVEDEKLMKRIEMMDDRIERTKKELKSRF